MAYQELVKDWNRGILALEKGNLDSALNIFRGIKNPPSKIEFNIGCLYLQQGDLDQALEAFDRTISKDSCLAVGFFQRGYINLQLGRYEEALKDGRLALLYLRNNSCIDYKQLGLAFVMCTYEVLYNIAATHCRLGRWQEAREILEQADRQMPKSQTVIALKQVQDHLLLEPQSVPPGKIFRPPMEAEKLKEKDFLGQSKVISSAFRDDPGIGTHSLKTQKVFQGVPPPPGITPPRLPHESKKVWKPGEREADGAVSKGPQSECLLEAPEAPPKDSFCLNVRASFTAHRKLSRLPSLAELGTILQEECCRQAATIQVRYKTPGSADLIRIKSDEELRNLWQEVQGDNLTLWCQGEEEGGDQPVLYRMVGQHTYTSEAPEDLNFKDGDVLEILSEVNGEWLEGRCNGITGIFPKRFAELECARLTRL